MKKLNKLLDLLKERGYTKERLVLKLMEEMGEYCEAIEYKNGATRKIKKFKDLDPDKMLREEIADVVMVSLALANCERLKIEEVLEQIENKLTDIEQKHRKANGLPEYKG